MLRTSNLEYATTLNDKMIESFIVNVPWAVRSTHHTVLKSSPGAAIFGRDMLFDLPYIADWTAIGQRRQQIANQTNARDNAEHIDYDYAVG